MSNRLKELLPKPTFADYHPADGKYSDFYDDKKMLEYGARIVQECMNLVKECYAEPNSGQSPYLTACATTIIEDHFGAEE